MGCLNSVTLIGRLGRDPETKTFDSGSVKCSFSLATSEQWKDKSGEKQERTDWHNVIAFGKTGEIAGKYLKKGSEVCVFGRLQYRKYTPKEGGEKWITEINADRLVLIGSRADGGGGGGGSRSSGASRGTAGADPADEFGGGGGTKPARDPAPMPDDFTDVPF